MKERIIAYDYIRIVAMLLVVACHCFGDVSSTSNVVISLLSYLEAPCNGLFFAVSGALLLPINSTTNYTNTKGFIAKRLKKVAFPTMLWSIVYLVLSGNLNLVSVCSIPFSAQGASVLWFMYVMVGLYLVAPIISPWLENIDKKTLELYLGFWLISLCFPILNNWLIINESLTGLLFYFSGFVGYFVLGYYLKKYEIQLKLSFLFFVIAFIIMVLVKLFASEIYGIVEYLIPHIDFISAMPYFAGYSIRIIIAFSGALILSYIVSYLPFANYIIGYSHKKQK